MDKSILVQYRDLQEEIRDLQRRIEKLQNQIAQLDIVSDSVTGTRRDGTIGQIKITGFPLPEFEHKRGLLQRRRKALEQSEMRCREMLGEVEQFIDGIEDSRVRRIFRHRYIDGMSWVQVAVSMGGKHTADSCRMAHDRYLTEK